MRRYINEHGIILEFKLSKGIPPINAPPQQIGEVILNLIRNAVKVITGNWENTLSGMNRVAEDLIMIETLPGNQEIIINIRDNVRGFQLKICNTFLIHFIHEKKAWEWELVFQFALESFKSIGDQLRPSR